MLYKISYAFSLLPLRLLYLISDVCYYLLYYVVKYRRKTVSENIKNSFTSLNKKERLIIEKKFYRNFCDNFIETLKLLSISKEELHSRISVDYSELINIKSQNKNIVGISAPGRSTTVLNFCNINSDTLDYITEKSDLKIGKYTPGTHIKIYSDDFLKQDKPDYALILAWNFALDIIKNNTKFAKQGGKFIIPIPFPKII